jgi:two-component system, OmpR family, sensor kinase
VVTVNEMLARLERMFAAQREFLADASHELRGPLMVIRGNLDLLRLGLPEEERRASVREASEEVDRMSRLASDLLFLAAADAEEAVDQEAVRLDLVVAGVWERARHLDAGDHDLRLVRSEPLTVVGDRGRLDQLVWNLVENALRYTPRGGSVELELAHDGADAVLRVGDTGVGIPAEHLPRIFERFYRVDRARSRSNGGTGLGLAIVKSVVEAHGGRVAVSSIAAPGAAQGTSFTVWLPAQPAPDGSETSSANGRDRSRSTEPDGASEPVTSASGRQPSDDGR